MLDLEWWEQEETGAITRAIMGVECEWAPTDRLNEIIYDFRKLLSFKAPLKVMIFECSCDKRANCSWNVLKKALEQTLEKFQQHVKGESYLFVHVFPHKCNGHLYKIDGYIYCSQADGKAPSVELARLK